MENKSVCRKVSSMLSLYIDNRLTYQESVFIEEHLANCSECRAKYFYLQSLIKELKSSYKMVLENAKKKQEQKIFSIREHEKFLDQLYPYVDNELSEEECFEFKKYLTKSENAQRELKNIYKIQKELKNSFDKIKTSLNTDFSQKISQEINPDSFRNYGQSGFVKRKLFSSKIIKVAVLAGLILWGGYEAETWYKDFNKHTETKPIQQEKDYSSIIVNKKVNQKI